MLNNVVVAGRLVKDPELKYTSSGDAVCNFSIAVQRDYKDKTTGEYEADFFNCVSWRQTAEMIANYLKKGAFISIIGKLESRYYEANDGKRVYLTEINVNQFHFLDKKENSDTSEQQNKQQFNRYSAANNRR
jgi:single-strand DNA-binding protein